MYKIMGSKISVGNPESALSMEFFALIEDLLYTDTVKELADWHQHKHISRLQHSLNVSYYSFLLSRKLGLDTRSATRGGLLHDLFFFNWRELKLGARHITVHPREALYNAERLTELNDMERDIIAKHMWPCGGRAKYRETLVVSFVDKYCALTEYIDYLRLYIKGLGCPIRNG